MFVFACVCVCCPSVFSVSCVCVRCVCYFVFAVFVFATLCLLRLPLVASSTSRHVFLLNKKTCLRVEQEDMFSC